MTVHALFPTLLLERVDDQHETRKDLYIRQVMKHLDADGYSDESTGHVTLHHDPIFHPICQMATQLARQHCEVMQIDPDLFDFNIVKTWLNIVKDRATPRHAHADAHLSFVYYINVPEACAQPIQFYAHPFPCGLQEKLFKQREVHVLFQIDAVCVGIAETIEPRGADARLTHRGPWNKAPAVTRAVVEVADPSLAICVCGCLDLDHLTPPLPRNG